MRKKQRPYVIIRVALILFCLVLFSAHLMSGVLAKYTFNGTESNSASVAKSDFSITSEDTPTVANDGSASYTFTVENTGEVTVGYSLVVCLKPDILTDSEAARAFSNVKIDDTAGTYDAAAQTYTFSDLGEFEVGESATHTLTFDTNDFVAVSSAVTVPTNTYKDIAILISAKTVQID